MRLTNPGPAIFTLAIFLVSSSSPQIAKRPAALYLADEPPMRRMVVCRTRVRASFDECAHRTLLRTVICVVISTPSPANSASACTIGPRNESTPEDHIHLGPLRAGDPAGDLRLIPLDERCSFLLRQAGQRSDTLRGRNQLTDIGLQGPLQLLNALGYW